MSILVPACSRPTFVLQHAIVKYRTVSCPRGAICLLSSAHHPRVGTLTVRLNYHCVVHPRGRRTGTNGLGRTLRRAIKRLITYFSTSFIPAHGFLAHAIKFFRGPKITLIRAPRDFCGPSPVTHGLNLRNILAPRRRIFCHRVRPVQSKTNDIIYSNASFIIQHRTLRSTKKFIARSLDRSCFASIHLTTRNRRIVCLGRGLDTNLTTRAVTTRTARHLQ